MKTLSLILIFALLASCKTVPPVVHVVPDVKATRTPPAAAMAECPKAKKLDDSSFGAVVRKLQEVIGLLDECSSKQGELSNFIKTEK